MQYVRVPAANLDIDDEWWTGWPEADIGASFQFKVTVLDGSLDGGSSPVGEWVSGATEPIWYARSTGPSTATATIRLQIRTAIGAIFQDQADFPLEASTFA